MRSRLPRGGQGSPVACATFVLCPRTHRRKSLRPRLHLFASRWHSSLDSLLGITPLGHDGRSALFASLTVARSAARQTPGSKPRTTIQRRERQVWRDTTEEPSQRENIRMVDAAALAPPDSPRTRAPPVYSAARCWFRVKELQGAGSWSCCWRSMSSAQRQTRDGISSQTSHIKLASHRPLTAVH